MNVNCLHCGVEFTQVSKGKRRKYCSKQCSQLAAYYRNVEYYRQRYKNKKEQILIQCREYRNDPRVQQLRKGYYEKYKESDQARRKQRYRSEEWYRSRNRSRCRARTILRRIYPNIACCYCKSRKSVICHHIDENPLNNTSSNLCWLCSRCHGIIHSIVPTPERDQILHSIQQFPLQIRTCS